MQNVELRTNRKHSWKLPLVVTRYIWEPNYNVHPDQLRAMENIKPQTAMNFAIVALVVTSLKRRHIVKGDEKPKRKNA